MVPSYVTPKSLVKANSLMTIKDFSEMSGIEQSTLRYWDSLGLFPAQRNPDTSYRYYSPDQIITVNFIKVLSNLNVPLKEMVELANSRSPEAILMLMERQKAGLNQELRRLQDACVTIDVFQDTIRQVLSVPDLGAVYQQSMEAMRISIGPHNQFDKNRSFYPSFLNYCRYASQNQINLNTPIGGYWESMDRLLEDPSLPTAFFSIDPDGGSERPSGEYLVGYAQGYYGQKGDAPQRMAAYAGENGLHFDGPVYVLYLIDEICERDPSKYVAQICAGIAKQ